MTRSGEQKNLVNKQHGRKWCGKNPDREKGADITDNACGIASETDTAMVIWNRLTAPSKQKVMRERTAKQKSYAVAEEVEGKKRI